MHVVFDTEPEANAFIAQINQLLGYPMPNVDMATGQIVGYTETWAVPEKFPEEDKWAVLYKPAIDPVLGDLVPQDVDAILYPDVIGIPPG
ncbi:hypothetical protein BE21_57440 [Sorangium cellulosum]|uniref:Uncharacterized protein n=1 Tax=Sorangium cellulosum TaxID=56 RepID=A0A150U3E8_SORCE|nr:hypothetical protein BE21_57440 [Sorangium cellulosum]